VVLSQPILIIASTQALGKYEAHTAIFFAERRKPTSFERTLTRIPVFKDLLSKGAGTSCATVAAVCIFTHLVLCEV